MSSAHICCYPGCSSWVSGPDLHLHGDHVHPPFTQVYDRVKGGDEYQTKLDVLPTRVAECEEAIRQEQGQVQAKQAEKTEQVCMLELRPLLIVPATEGVLRVRADHAASTNATTCTSAASRSCSIKSSHRLMHFGGSEDAGLAAPH